MNPNTTPYQEALGSALNDARAAEKVAALDAQDFESETDKAILGAIKSLSADRQPITLITVGHGHRRAIHGLILSRSQRRRTCPH